MLVILMALILAVIGLVRLARTLEPGQRLVLVLVFIVALVYVMLRLVQLGILGRATSGDS